MRLGKLPPKPSAHAPSLRRLAKSSLPPPPLACDWTTRLTGTPQFLNQTLGCCTIATLAHIQRVWTSTVWGEELDIPDELIRSIYFSLTGGADTGLAETDVLAFWASKGVDLPGNQYVDLLTGWATLDPAQPDEIKRSVAWFGAAYLGLALPAYVQGAASWDAPIGDLTGNREPGSWGGHAVPAVAYDAEGVTVLTWGKPLRASWEFLAAYMDEAHAPVSRTWLATNGLAPSGLDLAHLEACMEAMEVGA